MRKSLIANIGRAPGQGPFLFSHDSFKVVHAAGQSFQKRLPIVVLNLGLVWRKAPRNKKAVKGSFILKNVFVMRRQLGTVTKEKGANGFLSIFEAFKGLHILFVKAF